MMSESEYPFEAFLWSNQAQEPITAQKLRKRSGYAVISKPKSFSPKGDR
ncbi:MAG: nuclease A inhibitor family protein [Nostoc sp.]